MNTVLFSCLFISLYIFTSLIIYLFIYLLILLQLTSLQSFNYLFFHFNTGITKETTSSPLPQLPLIYIVSAPHVVCVILKNYHFECGKTYTQRGRNLCASIFISEYKLRRRLKSCPSDHSPSPLVILMSCGVAATRSSSTPSRHLSLAYGRYLKLFAVKFNFNARLFPCVWQFYCRRRAGQARPGQN